MPTVEVQVFQIPGVRLDGQPVSFPFKRVDALFYYLVCQKDVTRHEMVNLLWADCSEELGYKNLRHTLYILRKTLGADIVLTNPKTELRLNPARTILCDFDRPDSHSARNVDQFLRGFTVKNAPNFNAWVDKTREQLNGQIMARLSAGANDALARGELAEAERLSSEYLNWDGLDEQMTAFLMRLYRRDGRYYKAAGLYQRLKERLADELGISPLSETTALYYEIVNQWNQTTDEGADGALLPLTASRTALYQRLRAGYQDFLAAYSEVPSVLLWGDAGCGKSYLLQYFLRTEDLSRTLVLMGLCSITASAAPLECWRAVMLSLAQYFLDNRIELPRRVRSAVAAVFPVFAEKGEDDPPPPPPGLLTAAQSGAVALLFSLAARKQKILLVFENLQWMDAAGQDLLVQLLRRLGGSQLLLLAASRSRNLDLAFSLDDRLLAKLPVPCFTRQETGDYLLERCQQELSPAILARLYEATGGNPRLLTELAERLRGQPLTEEALPDAVSVLRRHRAGLSAGARKLAEVLALFQEKAPCHLLMELTGLSMPRLYDLSVELSENGLAEELYEDGESYLAFLHPRLRDALYESQSYFVRQPLHQRIADYLADRAGAHPNAAASLQLAYHCRQSGDALRTLRYTADYLDRFTRARCQVPPLADRSAPPWDGAPLDDQFQRQEQAISTLREQAAPPPAEELDGLERSLLCSRARYLIFTGRYQEGNVLLRKLLKQPAGPEFHLEVQRILISYELHIDQPESCRRLISRGIDLAQQAKLPRQRAGYLLLWGICFAESGDYYRADYFLSAAAEQSAQQDRDAGMFLAVAKAWQGECKRRALDFDGACQDYQAALDLMPHPGCLPGAGWIYTCYGRAQLAMGNESDADRLFASALSAYDFTHELPGRALAQCYAARCAAGQGRYDEAAALLAASRESASLLSSLVEQGIRDSVLAQLRRDLDQSGERNNALHRYLCRPLDIYCHRGLQRLRGIPGIYEYKTLEECLRFSANDARPLTAQNLYGKKRNFTAE